MHSSTKVVDIKRRIQNGQGGIGCHKLTKKSKGGSVIRRAVEVSLYCSANREKDERKKFIPFGRYKIGSETTFQVSVETLNHSIWTLLSF